MICSARNVIVYKLKFTQLLFKKVRTMNSKTFLLSITFMLTLQGIFCEESDNVKKLRKDLINFEKSLPEEEEKAVPMILGFFRQHDSILGNMTRNVIDFKKNLFEGFVQILVKKYNFGYQILHNFFG